MQNLRLLVRVGLACVAVAAVGLALPGHSQDTSKSIHTIVGAAADGSSQIQKEVIEECIMHIPGLDELRPVSDATSVFVKNINGKLDDNRSVRTWSSVVQVPYVVRQKTLVVVTVNSVERSEPVFREVAGRFDRSITFSSNAENGDMFGGRELLEEYFFSTAAKAEEDALRRAKAWIEQQQAVLCQP